MKQTFFLLGIALVCISFMGGCQSAKVNMNEIVNMEASRLGPPKIALNRYANFELQEMEYSGGILADERKVKVADQLKQKFEEKINGLFSTWNADNAAGEGTLLVKPVLQNLYVVSSGSRFWIGALAGDSTIDMDMSLIDKTTGEEIANPRIMKNANAYSGGWTVGGTDQNLLNYIVEISYEYLVRNYNAD